MRDKFLDYCRLVKHLTNQGYNMPDAQKMADERVYGPRQPKKNDLVKSEPEDKLAGNPPNTSPSQEEMNLDPKARGEKVAEKSNPGFSWDGHQEKAVVKKGPEQKLAGYPSTTCPSQEEMLHGPRPLREKVVIKNAQTHSSDGLPATNSPLAEAAKSAKLL